MWKIQENSGYDLSDSSINSYNMSLVSVLTIRFLLPWIPWNASKTGWSYDLLETSPHPQFSGCLLTLFYVIFLDWFGQLKSILPIFTHQLPKRMSLLKPCFMELCKIHYFCHYFPLILPHTDRIYKVLQLSK